MNNLKSSLLYESPIRTYKQSTLEQSTQISKYPYQLKALVDAVEEIYPITSTQGSK